MKVTDRRGGWGPAVEQNLNALQSAMDYLQIQGFGSFETKRLGDGRQSSVFRITATAPTGHVSAFALKVFQSDYRFNSRHSIRSEFDSLRNFYEALKGANECEVYCPLALALFEGDAAYLMTHIEGTPLTHFCFVNNDDLEASSAKIARGLSLYYNKMGAPYGDFSPLNLLVNESTGQIGFLDPTSARPFELFKPTFGPSTIDLGYWLAGLSAQSFKMMMTDPREYSRRWHITRSLARILRTHFAPDKSKEYLNEARMAGLRFLSIQLKRTAFRKRLLGQVAPLFLAYEFQPDNLSE
jgi:hypothetical protein